MSDEAVAVRDDQWDRLSTLFELIVSRPSGERASLLEETCGTDAGLRRELESLIAAHDGASAFLDALYTDVVQTALADGAPAADVDRAGDGESIAVLGQSGMRIRHYTVHERLGSGGAGVVFRGRDTLLARDVAIKFLAPRVSTDPAARARLIREAQAASRLENPHVCAIHAVEPTADGGLCIVMAFCAGGTLRDRIRRGPIPARDLGVIALHLARGLACAHQAGIVHGDIKPANVGFGEGDVARLLDFGVAIHAHEAAGSARGLSGTLPYLAPELWRGDTRDPRTDVWALGVTFFEMVTGQRPFVATHADALSDVILAAQLPPVVRSDGTALAPEFEQLIRRMLSGSSDDRPADGAAVLAAIDAWPVVAEGAVASARVPAASRVEVASSSPVRWRRRVLPVAGVAVVAVAVALATIVSPPRQRRVVSPPPAIEVARTNRPLSTIAILPFSVRGGRDIAYLANGMVDLLTPAFDGTGLVRGIDPNTVIGATGDRPAATLDSAAARAVASTVRADRYVVGSVVRTGATLTFRATLRQADGREVGRAQTTVADSNGLTSGIDALVRQLIATELLAPGDTIASIAATTTTSTRALRAYLDGERDLRDARPAAAVAHFQLAVGADSLFALAWYRLARAARWNDVYSLSASAARHAYALAGSLPPRQQTLVRAYYTLRFGGTVEAERQLAQIVADYPTDVEAWMLLGELQFSSNPYYGRPIDESATAFGRVMALDPRYREVTVYLMDLAANADRRGQLDTLFRMYFSPNSAGEQPGIRATYIALHDRRTRSSARTRATSDTIGDPELARVALRHISADIRDRNAARAYATTVAAAPASRVEGLLALATLDVANGAWSAAAAHFRDASILDPDRAMEGLAVSALAPSVSISADTLRAIRRALLGQRTARSVTDDDLTAIEREDVRHYLAGMLSVRIGDSSGVAAARGALATRAATPSRVAAPLAAAIAGHWQLRRGNLTAAHVAFEQSIPDIPARLRSEHPALGQHLDRLARATTLQRLGRSDDARGWYRSLREGAGIAGAAFVAAADSGPAAPGRVP